MKWPGHINEVVQGDCIEVMRTIPDQVIQTCITSPPYWGLRDYGIDPIVWGGKKRCKHSWVEHRRPSRNGTIQDEGSKINDPKRPHSATTKPIDSAFCSKCNAWLGSLGLEPNPYLYVNHIVDVFREVRRILANDGTIWINLGDSYCGSWGNYGGEKRGRGKQRKIKKGSIAHSRQSHYLPPTARVEGIKPKDLIGIPWMVAFALRADGWYLRRDIIWHKPNPMPESVEDRPTTAHEYIFLLSKREKKYYYDSEAIKEPITEGTIQRLSQNISQQLGSDRAHAGSKHNGPMKAVSSLYKTPSGWDTSIGFGRHNRANIEGIGRSGVPVGGNQPGRSDGGRISRRDSFKRSGAVSKHILPGQNAAQHREDREDHPPNGMRNKRSVWTVVTESCKDAHFATYPVKLIEPCILAGSRPGDIVLDPFSGSGRTAKRSKELGRKYIAIELNPEYIKISDPYLAQRELLLDNDSTK